MRAFLQFPPGRRPYGLEAEALPPVIGKLVIVTQWLIPNQVRESPTWLKHNQQANRRSLWGPQLICNRKGIPTVFRLTRKSSFTIPIPY